MLQKHRRPLATMLIVLAVGGSTACIGYSTQSSVSPTQTPTTPTVTAVQVTGAAPPINSLAPFQATALFSDQTTQVVTTKASWQSANPTIAIVNTGDNTGGVVLGVGPGDTDISAVYGGVTGRVHISIPVGPPALVEP